MKFRLDPHQAWIRGQTVAVAWFGALLSPLAAMIPIRSSMFWILLVIGMFSLLGIFEGVMALRSGSRSDFVAKAVIPALLLLLSTGWVAWGMAAA